jgi:acetoin utilization deacetylase AcuC-like enzyme
LIRPQPISYGHLSLVHTPDYLDAVSRSEVLARIFAAAPSEIPVDELLLAIRFACGGTLEAARHALAVRAPVLNTLGGFHHAAPGRGGGFCALNDVAVAIAVLRSEGFSGQIVVIDIDAHPPDGTAECLRSVDRAWIGSVSGSHWADLSGVDSTVLPKGSGDAAYLTALEALMSRMPKPELAFVNAGGDVLAGDRFGLLGLTLEGARRRDLVVYRALKDVPSVWTPGGGYQAGAWKVLVGTGLVLCGRAGARIPELYDPLASHFRDIAAGLNEADLQTDPFMSQRELDDLVAKRLPSRPTLLGLYSREGVEYALYRYGVIPHIERLGYRNVRVVLDTVEAADRVRLLGQSEGVEHTLLELLLQRRGISGEEYLFVDWLALRHPRAQFSALRPQLPGQNVPGLGLAREIIEILSNVARRLGLKGVAFRPSWYHTAYAARHRGRFVDPARQGRFEALVRDMSGVPLLVATSALAEGLVRMNQQPYRWEADDMVDRLGNTFEDQEQVALARESSHFTL